MTRVSSITLNNGVSIPQLGLGVFKIPNAETETVVISAIEIGCRSIDTAKIYGNEAWAPLGQGGALASPEIAGIAATYGKSPAQVILRWHIQIGAVAIPKSVRSERLAENLDIFDFELSAEDMALIARGSGNAGLGSPRSSGAGCPLRTVAPAQWVS